MLSKYMIDYSPHITMILFIGLDGTLAANEKLDSSISLEKQFGPSRSFLLQISFGNCLSCMTIYDIDMPDQY